MSLTGGRAKLIGAWKDLLQRWDRAKTSWDDVVSHELEESFVSPLERDIRATVSAMEKTMEVVARARKDCS